MTFFCINRRNANTGTVDLLKESAEKKGIPFQELYSNERAFVYLPNLAKNDILYNVCLDHKSRTLEKCLLNHEVTTLYSDNQKGFHSYENVVEATIILGKKELPIIQTIYDLTNNRQTLKMYVEFLGGFPIILKSTNGSQGVGVMKIDSLDSLYSIVDVLISQEKNFIIRKFIEFKKHARFIVLGNEVIASIEYKKIADDFRTNAGETLNTVTKKFPKKVENVAVDSVKTLGFDFGGVDVLIDKNNNFHIAEVNFPCMFSQAQKTTSVDISGKIIDFLIEKNRQHAFV